MTYPEVGKIAGVLGAVGGLLCIYLLPTVTYIAQKKSEITHSALVNALRQNDYLIPSSKN
jgi:hypothetical protein